MVPIFVTSRASLPAVLTVLATTVLTALSASKDGGNLLPLLSLWAVVILFVLHYQRRIKSLESTAETDRLTGLFNRGAGEERLKMECMRSSRTGRPVALVSLDLDHFKAVNDTFGHPAGDAVLKTAAGIMGGCARKLDSVIRAGGEEFWILLPETDLDEAKVFAGRLRTALDTTVCFEGEDIKISASIGISLLGEEMFVGSQIAGDELAGLLKQLVSESDEALYRAKQSGRNRVCVACG